MLTTIPECVRTPRRPPPPTTLAPLTALLLSGCLGSDLEPERTVVRDSAGVRIVETSIPAWEGVSGWEVVEAPLVEIGAEDGERPYLFARVAGAVRLPDGGIVVGDGTSNELRFFDEAGRFIRAVGQSGQGPGEFEFLRAVRRCGEGGLTAFDLSWEAKLYTEDGELIREMRLVEPGSERTPYALDCSPDGRFVITGWGDRTAQPTIGFYASPAPVWLLDADGQAAAELGSFVASERIGSQFGSRPHPFGRAAVVAMGAEEVFIGPSETFEVLAFALDGQVTRILRGPSLDLEVRPEHLARYREALLEEAGPERRQAVEAEVREMPLPPAFPAYDRMMVDPEGSLWVRRFRRPGDDGPTWAVFDSTGVLLGDVTTPEGLEITEIGSDYILGVHQDVFGVERVRLHELRRAE